MTCLSCVVESINTGHNVAGLCWRAEEMGEGPGKKVLRLSQRMSLSLLVDQMATGIPSEKGERRKEKGRSQDMATAVEGGQQKGKGGPRPSEEGLTRSTKESTLSFPNAMLLALSCPVGKGFEGAKCELYPKVNEE